MVYLLCYAASVFLVYLARKSKNKDGFWLLIILSALITIILSGLRGITIGTDTINYYNLEWQKAQYEGVRIGYIEYCLSESRTIVPEILFDLIGRFAYKLTGSYNFFMMCCHTIIISCVYIGAFRLKKHAEPELVILFFYFLYLGQSFNITRQFMAMAIIFAFTADLEQKRYIRYTLIVVVCLLIHNSAVLGMIPMFLHIFLHLWYKKQCSRTLNRNKISFPYSNPENHPILRAIVCITIIGLIVNFSLIINVAVKLGVLSRKYLWYLDTADQNESSRNIVTIAFLMIEFMGLALWWDQLKHRNHEFDFYIVCSLTFVIFNSLGSMIHYGDRLSEYYSLINVVTIGSIEKYQKLRVNRQFLKLCMLFVVLLYWGYVYVLRNSNNTMPYYIQIY